MAKIIKIIKFQAFYVIANIILLECFSIQVIKTTYYTCVVIFPQIFN